MLESSFLICALSCEFVFLVMISIFSAPELSVWGLVDHQVHLCFSLPSVTVHQPSTQPASWDLCSTLVCAGPGRGHTDICTGTHNHACTCTYMHTHKNMHIQTQGRSNSPAVSVSSSPETDFCLIGGTPCLVPHHLGHLLCSSFMTSFMKSETQSLECIINKYPIAGLTLTHF